MVRWLTALFNPLWRTKMVGKKKNSHPKTIVFYIYRRKSKDKEAMHDGLKNKLQTTMISRPPTEATAVTATNERERTNAPPTRRRIYDMSISSCNTHVLAHTPHTSSRRVRSILWFRFFTATCRMHDTWTWRTFTRRRMTRQSPRASAHVRSYSLRTYVRTHDGRDKRV